MALAKSTRPGFRSKAKAKSCIEESSEDRKQRLAKRAADRRRKIAAETPAERESRLAKAREYERKRNARLSPEQKLRLSEYRKAYVAANKDQLKLQRKQYRERTKEAKRIADKSYRDANKEAIREQRRRYREINREVISQKKKARYQQNKEEIKQKERLRRQRDPQRYREMHNKSQKQWRLENKDRVRAIYSRHMKKKRREDPLFDLKCKCRERIAHALRKTGARKSERTIKLIGCSAAQLAAHLESLFEPGMTWGNRGRNGWHIDHIIPLAKFDLTDPEQQAAAFHYTNLQPLWAKDNIRKGAKILGQQHFGFALAARIAEGTEQKPKRKRRASGRQHIDH